jgi:hypothetical protein
VTPVPLELPLRPAEAAELANLIFEHAEKKHLTEEVRTRLAGRASALKLETITPYFGSLERDPVHPSAYYLAVDGVAADGTVTPQLLYMALANAPTSSIYHKALLIGRMRRLNGPECVINSTPFGPADRASVEAFAARIDAAFYPQPQGARSTITVEEDYPAAIAMFRAVQRRTGRNLAALAGDSHAAMWSAICAGWRQGYTVSADLASDCTEEQLRESTGFSRYSVSLAAGEAGLRLAEEKHEQIRQARAALKLTRGFDFEVRSEEPLSSEALGGLLTALKEGAHLPQLVDAGPADEVDVEALAVASRQFQVTLSFRFRSESGATLDRVAKATGGRVNYRVRNPAEAEIVMEHLV